MPRPRYHTVLSIALAGAMVARTRRWQDAIPVLVADVLVDLDHLVDLFANRGKGVPVWAILPLHAWEWVFALVLRHRRRTDGFAAGLAAHLALDQLNPVISHPFFYWISLRAANGFRATRPLVDPEHWARESGWMRQHPGEWF